MAAKAEVLRKITLRSNTTRRSGIARSMAKAIVAWGRRGQLGSSHSADMARYTGARF